MIGLVVKLKTVFAKKIDISKTEQKDMEENDVAEKSLNEAIDGDEGQIRILDRIFETADDLTIRREGFGEAFTRAGTYGRIELVNQISSLLVFMKEYVDSELADLNELHSKIK